MSEDARVELRAYLPEDAAATLAVFRRAVRVTAAGDYTPAQIEAWASDDIDAGDWAARRLASATVVAVAEGRVVGFSDVDDSGCIDMLFVDPAEARRGVASRLLESLGDGPRSVHASRTARPFFERHGFVVVAEGRPIIRGVELVNYLMVRGAVGNSGSVREAGPPTVTRTAPARTEPEFSTGTVAERPAVGKRPAVAERPAVGNSGSVPGDDHSPADPDDDSPHRA